MKAVRYSLFIFIISFLGCNRQTDESLFPVKDASNGTTIKFPSPQSTQAKWINKNQTASIPKKVKTNFKEFTEPFFYTERFHPLTTAPDSFNLNLKDLPSQPFSLPKAVRKVTPKIIKLGKPTKTKAASPVVDNISTCGLMQLSVDQGLSSTAVMGTIQDDDGRLWMATDHGLTLYDGEYFYTWYKRDGMSRDELRFIFKDKRGHIWIGASGVDEIIPELGIIKRYGKPQGISNRGIIAVKEDNNGKIIFALAEGIDILDPLTDSITYIGPERGVAHAFVNTLTIDNKNRLWLALNGGGVNVIDIAANKIYFITEKNGLSNNDIRDIMQDKAGNIWMGGWNGGVDCYNPLSGKFYQLREKNGFCDRYIRSLTQDSKGLIWIGCLSGGLDVYDPATKKLFHPYGKKGIVRSDCRSVFEDKYERMWISTNGGGILLYDPTMGTKDNFDTKWRYAKAPVNTTLEDADGNFWIGSGGQGMDVYNTKEKTLKHLMNEDWTDGWLNKLYDDSVGNLWMITDYKLDQLNKATSVVTSWGKDEGLPNETVRSFVPIKKEGFFLGTSGGVDRFEIKAGIFSHLEITGDPCNSLISALSYDDNGHLWIATYFQGVFDLDTTSLQVKHYYKKQGLNKTFIYSMLIDKTGSVWLGTGGDGLKILGPKNNTLTQLNMQDGLSEMTVLSLLEKDNKIYAGTIKGLSVVEKASTAYNIVNYDKPQGFESTDFNQNSVMKSSDGKIWWGIGEMLTIFKPAAEKKLSGKTFITSIDVMEKELVCKNDKYLSLLQNTDTIWTPSRDTFYFKNNLPPDTGYFISNNIKWKSTSGVFNLPGDLTLPYYEDHITFHFSSNFISNTNRTIYRYILQGADNLWSQPTSQTSADYRNLAPGKYTFKVCSSNFNSPFTEISQINFTITPPWWKTTIAYILYALCFIGCLVGYNRLRNIQLFKRQRELEKNVKERTAEIEDQKNEIGHQKQLIEEKQKEIVDSISYAKRLQDAILPSKEFVNANLKNNFIYYQPKDIVAGDFYWAEKVNDLFFIAAADSTGHGVPGAMVSVVCSNALNRALKEFKLTETGKILDKTRDLVLETFEKSTSEVKDGMDISLLCIDAKNKIVSWSGANNPLWYIDSSFEKIDDGAPGDFVLKEIKADKQPIGKTDYPKPFTTHKIDYKEGTTFYLFTDGLADQFGGPRGKKFKYKQFSELLLKIHNNTDQETLIEKAFDEWKGNLEQVDDVCVIGIKL